MEINYYDTDLFDTKEIVYNSSEEDQAAGKKEVVYLDVKDIRKRQIQCERCKINMDVKSRNTSFYYDVDEENGDNWRMLCISYRYVNRYRCRKCRKTKYQEKDINPSNQLMSKKLKKKIAFLLWSGTAGKITRQEFIQQCTIDDLKEKPPRKIELIDGKARVPLFKEDDINIILKEYRTEVEKLIKSYKLHDEIIYYPFVYFKKERGAVLGLEGESETDSKLYLYHLSTSYSDDELAAFLGTSGLEDIDKIAKIYVSPLQFPLDKTSEKASDAFVFIMREGIEYELDKISAKVEMESKAMKQAERKKQYQELLISIRKINAEMASFLSKYSEINALFTAMDTEVAEYYKELRESFERYPKEWRKNQAVKGNDAIKDVIDYFDDSIENLQSRKVEFEYLLTRLMLEISQKEPVIQKYSWDMGSLRKTVGKGKDFGFCTASAIMLRPVCDEYFILPFEMDKSNYFLVVGYDVGRYCSYDIIKGKTPKVLVNYFEKLTIWEQEQVKNIYCRFDHDLIYSLKAILFNATFFVDLEQIVDGLYDICLSDDINALVETIRNIKKPDYEPHDDPYLMWEPFHRSCADVLQEWYYDLDNDGKRDFAGVYARLAVAPELLQNSYLFMEKRPNYPEVETLIDIAYSSASYKELQEKARTYCIKRCIEECEELEGHRVLMGYADLEIKLDDWLNYINSIDWKPASD